MFAKEAYVHIGRMPPDEPVFVLRGRDPLAANVVKYWIEQFTAHLPADRIDHVAPTAKAYEAMECAEAMAAYQPKKYPD